MDINKINYTSWVIALIVIILNDNRDMHVFEIALNEDKLKIYFEKKLSPQYVYNDIWERDAGNYYKIPF